MLSGPEEAAAMPPLPLRSLQASKEAQFEADSDSLPEEDAVHVPRSPLGMRPDASADALPDAPRHALPHALPDAPLPDWLRRGAGVFEGTVNMANSILGAGIVGLPYAMRSSGLLVGVVLLVVLAVLTDWTIRLIVLNAKLSGRSTYIGIMEQCFGQHGKNAVSLFQFVFAFGGMCAFCVVVADTIPSVIASVIPALRGTFLSNRSFVLIACTVGISYPLSLYRDVGNLSKASAVALLSMVFIVTAVVVRGPAMPAELRGDAPVRLTPEGFFAVIRSVSVISFAFVCHHNSLLIYSSLKEPTMDKFGRITHYSTLLSAVAATTMAVAGYAAFGDKTMSNVLNNFPTTDAVVDIARLCFGINMFTTLPLECLVCRDVVETYFFHGVFDQRRHVIVTTALVGASLIVALSTCDLGLVLELTGGLSATALAFFFPSICYLKLRGAADVAVWAALASGDEVEAAEAGTFEVQDSDDEERPEEREAAAETLLHAPSISLPLRPGAAARAGGFGWTMTTMLSVTCAGLGGVVLVLSGAYPLAYPLTPSHDGHFGPGPRPQRCA
ncbi:hypothetical protein MSPP1_002116 [Malassezia sp. CBS 17886]|nr:hypothetical protein MSPP1_002116 [Malassezia sp. CBS 17886]